MSTQKEPLTKSISIRFPLELLEQLRKAAKHHDRSLNGEVLTAIREHLKKSQKDQR